MGISKYGDFDRFYDFIFNGFVCPFENPTATMLLVAIYRFRRRRGLSTDQSVRNEMR